MNHGLTISDLRGRWALRERRYALSRRGPSDAGIDSARAWRVSEAAELADPVAQRLATIEALDWHPPKPNTKP
jgi:hypothetical protein